MRLDPKYFNLFMAVCALITVLVIIYGTISYTQKQTREFNENIEAVNLDELMFATFSEPDSLGITSLKGSPVVIQFWSTWSGKSMALNRILDSYQNENPSLKIVAAAVRDSDELIREYIGEHSYYFEYVNGTPFFQEHNVPGVPSQILINSKGDLFSTHVGDNSESLLSKIDRLLQDE